MPTLDVVDHRRRRRRVGDRPRPGRATRCASTLVEAATDVGDGTSKANTAILHTGSTPSPARWRPGWSPAGYELLGDYAGRPASPSSAPARCWSPGPTSSSARCRALEEKARANGYTRRLRSSTRHEVYAPRAAPRGRRAGRARGARREHHLPLDDAAGLRHRGGAARRRPASLRPPASSASRRAGRHTLLTTGGDVRAPAGSSTPPGCGADDLDGDVGHERFTVTPRRGELIVFDKLARPLLGHDPAAGADRRRPRACWWPRPCTAT